MKRLATADDGAFDVEPTGMFAGLYAVHAVSDGTLVGYIDPERGTSIPPCGQPELAALLERVYDAARGGKFFD